MGAFYSNTVTNFVNDDSKSIIGSLATQSGIAGFHQLLHSQTLSWGEEINVLQSSLNKAIIQNPQIGKFGILLEYPIARRAKRIDAVIIANNLVIVIEFKVGQSEYLNADKEQLLDYCLDIRDFHFESRNKIIVPVLIATNGNEIENICLESPELVKEIFYSNSNNLATTIVQILKQFNDDSSELNYKQWDASDYSPTPTIIEAAQALYAGKSVVEISQSHARQKNLKPFSFFQRYFNIKPIRP